MARLHEYHGKAILAANGFKVPRRVQRLIRFDRNAGVPLYPSTMVNAPALVRRRVSDNAGTSRQMFVRVVQADFED